MILTNGLGTLCRQRMIVMMFIGMYITPDIVRRNARRTSNSSYHIEPWKSASFGLIVSARTSVHLGGVVRYRLSQLLLSLII